ncbi:hypothetical protein MtrunA17_Chr7g0240761 [Medicago truncatula]|uniref:Uncharacterized protein n=1 Tax=Medicago truncatula TaxID=3880 RepID=A0A396H0M7_MEDTR|nr:hypothetical protein MtrunA17_Chr7g0240761 [Medicago truncatula]
MLLSIYPNIRMKNCDFYNNIIMKNNQCLFSSSMLHDVSLYFLFVYFDRKDFRSKMSFALGDIPGSL